MIRPIPIFLLASLSLLAGGAYAQSAPACKEIKVESRTESISVDKSKVTLQFGANHNPNDFTLSLFGEKRSRRLNFSPLEKMELVKGDYILVIQNKRDESFCTKQINLKLE